MIARAFEAGRDGRALIDRVCAAAPAYLRPGGYLLLVQASFVTSRPRCTVESLTAQGLNVEIAARRVVPMLTEFERAWKSSAGRPLGA